MKLDAILSHPLNQPLLHKVLRARRHNLDEFITDIKQLKLKELTEIELALLTKEDMRHLCQRITQLIASNAYHVLSHETCRDILKTQHLTPPYLADKTITFLRHFSISQPIKKNLFYFLTQLQLYHDDHLSEYRKWLAVQASDTTKFELDVEQLLAVLYSPLFYLALFEDLANTDTSNDEHGIEPLLNHALFPYIMKLIPQPYPVVGTPQEVMMHNLVQWLFGLPHPDLQHFLQEVNQCIIKQKLAWDLTLHNQMQGLTGLSEASTFPGTPFIDGRRTTTEEAMPHLVLTHTVSDKKLGRILSGIQLGKSQHEMVFGRAPYLSACVWQEGLSFFTVNPSVLQAKLVLSVSPDSIIAAFPNDIGSATQKYNTPEDLTRFHRALQNMKYQTVLLDQILTILSKAPHSAKKKLSQRIADSALTSNRVRALDPNKSKHPLRASLFSSPQHVAGESEAKQHRYNEVLIEANEANPLVVQAVLIEEAHLHRARQAKALGNRAASQALLLLETFSQTLPIVIIDTIHPVPKPSPQASLIQRLSHAVFNHDPKLIKEIIDEPDSPIDYFRQAGSVLQTACYVEDLLVVQTLIEKGCNVNYARGMPLLTAVHRRHFELVKLLLDSGADPSICQRELILLMETTVPEVDKSAYIALLGIQSLEPKDSADETRYLELQPSTLKGYTLTRIKPEHVSALNHWRPQEEDIPCSVLQALSDHYINIPYEDDWEKRFEYNGIVVYRPNHGTTHAIAQLRHSQYLIQALGRFNIPVHCRLTQAEQSILQLAAFITRAGRTNELRLYADPGNLKRSIHLFEILATHFGFEPKLIKWISHALANTPAPPVEGSFHTEKYHFMKCILQNAHRLDMVRMLDKPTFDRIFIPLLRESFAPFVPEAECYQFIENAIEHAVSMCQLLGNQCLYIGQQHDNHALKADSVKDVSMVWQRHQIAAQPPATQSQPQKPA